jgi:hypothetical protein
LVGFTGVSVGGTAVFGGRTGVFVGCTGVLVEGVLALAVAVGCGILVAAT